MVITHIAMLKMDNNAENDPSNIWKRGYTAASIQKGQRGTPQRPKSLPLRELLQKARRGFIEKIAEYPMLFVTLKMTCSVTKRDRTYISMGSKHPEKYSVTKG